MTLIPVGIVNASVGHQVLGTVTTSNTLAGWANATKTVNVIAGSDAASNDASTTFAQHFAICFSGCVGSSVVFSGSQFYLYLSKDGLAQISSSDVKYAGLFSVSDLTSTTPVMSKQTNGTFYLGTVGGDELLTGPLPVKISADYKYIKMFDGSIVAVSTQTVSIAPGLKVTPTSGPAGTQVTISGGGFPSTAKIAINYTFSYTSWSGTRTGKHGTWISSGITNNQGWFTDTAPITDVKQVYNPGGESGVIPLTPIRLSAVNASKLSQALTPLAGNVNFTENNRVFNQVVSYYPSGGVATFTTEGTYGNDSNSVGTLLPKIQVYYSGGLGIEGNYTAVGTTATVSIGGTDVGSVTSNIATGQYIINVTVSSLSVGDHQVTVSNNGVVYQFTITMNPTLILNPSSGPSTKTTVVAHAYGFPSSGPGFNGKVSLYWYQYTWGDATNYFLTNGTVGSNGNFNATVSFVAPLSYGGSHNVTASKFYYGKTTGAITGENFITLAAFTITPTFVICVTSTTCGSGSTNANTVSVNANTRTILNATGTGFGYVANGQWQTWYQVNIDNALYSDFMTSASNTGALYVNFTAAGFQPGLHQVELYSCSTSFPCVGAPVAIAYFNVTTIGAYIGTGSGGLPSSVINTINNINSTVNAIFAWQSTILGMNSTINNIFAWQSTILGMNSTVKTMNTNINTILGWHSILMGMNSTLTTINAGVKTIISDLAGISTAATNAYNAATSASTAATNAKNSVSDTETYVLVVAVLVAITLVLELAVLVRKLD
jgi:hypothetical protein